jgi:hypothetical protein
MYDTITLPDSTPITADQVAQLERSTTFTLSDALRVAAETDGVTQCVGFGDGETQACALSATYLVAERRGYLA